MLKIDILCDDLRIKNIKYESIENIYSIYKNTDSFKYATGVNNFISFDVFSSQLFKFISQNNVFFLDIFLEKKDSLCSSKSIGLVKGALNVEENILWINSIAIDLPYQSKGYGKKVVSTLENYFKNSYNVNTICLSVSKNNMSGVKFWEKCGYSEYEFDSTYDLHKITDHALIMWKKV
ncbi:GNAT family N-acetyltransferase [Ruminiclostridium josui]|uniref:GNAT family N-acetyltransferase n=1 Tax=Ruminiclostridium josui TaxID=1499 RepID=UPI000465C383|nr:N-acetyltransferase [Ruminiclostridium josui]